MAQRKTISVDTLREVANLQLKALPDQYAEQRLGICGLLERILFDTGNYNGYNYLPGGMDFSADPPEVIDETRRFYY